MPHAVVLGGNGLVGAAAAARLVGDGWTVTTTGRRPGRFPAALRERGVTFRASDRHDAADLATVLGAGADVVVDAVGYTAADARLLLTHAAGLGSVVFVSSKAVYVDAEGRHSNSEEPPDFGGPVTEDQPTLAPSDEPYDSPTGYGPNKVAAELAYLDSGMPVSVLRPSRIHGLGAARHREWVFVKRVLDGRSRLLLARGGRGANHPTAAVNLAALVATCAADPGSRVLNAADPDAPDGLGIARVVASHLGHTFDDEVLLPDDAPAGLGAHPWDTVPPFVLDTSAASALGYRPVGTYAETVGPALDELAAAARDGDPRGVLPAPGDPYFAQFLGPDVDAAEDAWTADGQL